MQAVSKEQKKKEKRKERERKKLHGPDKVREMLLVVDECWETESVFFHSEEHSRLAVLKGMVLCTHAQIGNTNWTQWVITILNTYALSTQFHKTKTIR